MAAGRGHASAHLAGLAGITLVRGETLEAFELRVRVDIPRPRVLEQQQPVCIVLVSCVCTHK